MTTQSVRFEELSRVLQTELSRSTDLCLALNPVNFALLKAKDCENFDLTQTNCHEMLQINL